MILVTLSLLLALASPASAHPLAFGVLDLYEDHYALRLSPEEGRDADALVVRWPEGCASAHEVRTRSADGSIAARGDLACESARRGTLIVEGLGPELTLLVRIHRGDDVEVQRLDASRPELMLESEAPDGAAFVALGVEHAATGLDHLLFLVGVVFLAGRARRVVLAVTAFTVGHAITLAVATYCVLAIDVPTVELCIALSLVALAHELTAAPGAPTLGARHPAVLSGAFGLLHGLGFATALGQTGMSAAARAVPLVAFHLGIELVQLVIVLAVLGALHVARDRATTLARVAAYAVGIAGVVMVLERL